MLFECWFVWVFLVSVFLHAVSFVFLGGCLFGVLFCEFVGVVLCVCVFLWIWFMV